MSLCTRCDGLGYTRAEAAVVKDRGAGHEPRFVTVAQGSGCTRCGGTGKEKST